MSKIGKNILKYTNLFKNLSSRLIFIIIFLLSPVFAKKYENLSRKTITTKVQKKRQEKANDLSQDKNQEKLGEHFSSEPFVKKPRSRPRKNRLTNSKNIPSETKRKRGRSRKQIYEDEPPEIYAQKRNRTKVESDSHSDYDYVDYLKQTRAGSRKRKIPKSRKILLNLQAKKVKIIFQPQKMKSTALKPQTKKIMEKITKKILKRTVKKTMKRTCYQTCHFKIHESSQKFKLRSISNSKTSRINHILQEEVKSIFD